LERSPKDVAAVETSGIAQDITKAQVENRVEVEPRPGIRFGLIRPLGGIEVEGQSRNPIQALVDDEAGALIAHEGFVEQEGGHDSEDRRELKVELEADPPVSGNELLRRKQAQLATLQPGSDEIFEIHGLKEAQGRNKKTDGIGKAQVCCPGC
jgi:hypothetical protein